MCAFICYVCQYHTFISQSLSRKRQFHVFQMEEIEHKELATHKINRKSKQMMVNKPRD